MCCSRLFKARSMQQYFCLIISMRHDESTSKMSVITSLFRPFPLLLFLFLALIFSSISHFMRVPCSHSMRYLFHSAVIRVLLFHLFAYLSIPADAASLLVQHSQYGNPSAPPAKLFMTDSYAQNSKTRNKRTDTKMLRVN